MSSLSVSDRVGGNSSSATMYKQDLQSLNHKSLQSDQSQEITGRKKRTFDIAFLTGQSESCEESNREKEKESNNNHQNHHVLVKRSNSSSSPCFSGQTTRSSSSTLCYSDPDFERESPYNLSQNQNHDTSSDSSMVDVEMDVDVMTNGSLSDVDADVDDATTTPIPKLTRMVAPQQYHNHSSLKRHSNSSSSNHQHHSRVLLSLSQSHYNNQNHHGKARRQQASSNNISTSTSTSTSHISDANGKPRGKSGKNTYPKNNPVKEEIRFESKRTIDINHSSLKIKENLQFSTLIPNHSEHSQNHSAHSPLHHHHTHLPSHPSEFNEFILPPHLATTFALFPHISNMSMSKFHGLLPTVHHGQHSNLNPNSNHPGQPQPQQSPHSGIHFSSSSLSKMEKSEGPTSFHHQHHSNLSSSTGHNNHSPFGGGNNQKIRHFPDIYPGYPYPNLIIPPQFSPQGNISSNQHSPNNVTTLLPPSLTALTLPAQNVCAKCSIGFRMTSDLVYHMRSHHKRDTFDPLKKQREEKLKCPVCHESFRERHHLTRHMTAHQDRVDEAAAAAAIAGAGGNNHGSNSVISIGESFGQSTSSSAGSSKLVA